MQDLLPVPSCFSISSASSTACTKPAGQSAAVLSSYRTLISGQPHIITVTWCKNLLALGLYLSIHPDYNPTDNNLSTCCCKVEMRPWHLWRRHGTKRFEGGGGGGAAALDVFVFWDLKTAKFTDDDPEPASDYYVAIVSGSEVVLLLGDHKHDAFRRSNARPSIHDPRLISKKEHVFAKRRFCTKARLEVGQNNYKKPREMMIVVEIITQHDHERASSGDGDCEMVIKIDGEVGVRVKHLQWKFRGHESVRVITSDHDHDHDQRVEVYWDVHDWMFGSCTSASAGINHRHALFIFKPVLDVCSSSMEEGDHDRAHEFCLFLYAWKLE